MPSVNAQRYCPALRLIDLKTWGSSLLHGVNIIVPDELGVVGLFGLDEVLKFGLGGVGRIHA